MSFDSSDGEPQEMFQKQIDRKNVNVNAEIKGVEFRKRPQTAAPQKNNTKMENDKKSEASDDDSDFDSFEDPLEKAVMEK